MAPAPETGDRWQSHPVRAALIRAAAVVIPVLASVASGLAVSTALPAARTFGEVVTQWVVVLTVSTVVALLVERLTRRLLPLATLLKLSMLFPDKAPSRFKVARKVAGTKALAVELERARRAGVHGDRQQAAETILSLVGMLGDYDSRTRGHSERTQLFVTMLADEMKLKADDRDKLVWAALVHDIGKLRVPTEVLNKPGAPDDDEWQRLREHPAAGATICSPLQEWLGPWWHAIEQHHERYDGGGYPYGLAGQEISLAARIVSVADSYEVMTAARPYKRAMSATAARAELARCAGTQFDPVVVRAFLSISLGRLRWAAGPLSWLAQLPILQPISNLGPHVAPVLSQVAGAAVGVAAAAGALLGLGLAPVAADDTGTVAQEEQPAQQDDVPSPAPTGAPTQAPAPTTSPTTSPTTVPSAAPSTTTAPAPVRPGPSVTEPAPVGSTPSPTPIATPTPEPTPTNHAPVAADDTATTAEDSTVDVDVLTNDADADDDTLSAELVSAPTHGSASLATGVVTYVPEAAWYGTEAITYQVTDPDGATSTATVTITVTPVNDAPVAADDTATTTEDTPVDVDVLTNDTDPDGDTLTATITTAPTAGTATLAGGTLTYTPDPDRNGPDTVGYTVTDPDGATSTATVTITVTPVNDAPVAADDTATTTEDTPVDVDVLTNDTDPDGDTLTATITTAPTAGTATLAGGTLTYTPDPDRNGPDTVGYTVTDPDGATSTATVTITVTPVNDAPVAADDTATTTEDTPVDVDVLTNDTDPDGDTLTATITTAPTAGTATLAGGTLTYTPDSDRNGPDTVGYTVTDPDGATSTATVTITVTPVNDAPVAADDTATTTEDTPVDVDVLTNDTDPDGDTLTATITTAPTAGTATLAGGTLTYTPDSDRNGPDTVGYTVTDPDGATSTATVTITVTPVNDAPTAADDSFTVVAGQPLTGDLLANDGDEDGDALVVTTEDSPEVAVASDGTFAWTPPSPGVRTFSYAVSDGAASSTATVVITVTAAPPTQQALFLIGSPAGTRGALSPTAPGAAGDWDGDGAPGLTIEKSSMDEDEDQVERFHEWDYTVPAGGLALDGPVRLELSSRTAELDLGGEHVDYSIWLYSCNAAGTSCVRLAAADDVHVDRWSPGIGWEDRTLQIGSVHQTIPAGRVLRVRLAFEHNDVRLALDGAHPSRLVWSTTG